MKVRNSTFVSLSDRDNVSLTTRELDNASRINLRLGGRNFVLGMSPERAMKIGRALFRAGKRAQEEAGEPVEAV